MSAVVSQNHVIEKLVNYISDQATKDQVESFIDFCRIFYDTVSPKDLTDVNVADLFGQAQSLWAFIAERAPGECKVRVYNPTQEQHGWESTHTIIEVVVEDMPFLVDSIRMEANRLGMLVHFTIHTGCLFFERSKSHALNYLRPAEMADKKSITPEAVIYMEIDRQVDQEVLNDLHDNILRVLGDVTVAVADWRKMSDAVEHSCVALESAKAAMQTAELNESKDFLQWLLNDHFVFLGSRDYTLVGKGEKQALQIIPGTGLGVLRDDTHSKFSRNLSELPPRVREMMLSSQALIIAKTNTISSVHRPSYTDYIGIKQFDKKGELIGIKLLIGLFTSAAYNSNPRYIPFVRGKLEYVLETSKLSPSGHAGKALLNILETLPRDDLFQVNDEELYTLSINIMHLQDRQRACLFVRKDYYNRFYSCLVYIPKEIFNTNLRRKIQATLMEAFNGLDSEFTTEFGDSILARVHFVVRVDSGDDRQVDIKALEEKVVNIAQMWTDKLKNYLIDTYGEAVGVRHYNKYKDAFSAAYQDQYTPNTALLDIFHMEKLSDENALEMSFSQASDDPGKLQLKLFGCDTTSPLSDVLPILENMGLRVLGERPSEIIISENKSVFINDFLMVHLDGKVFNVEALHQLFRDAFVKTWFNKVENDSFNRLILEVDLSWKQTALLRSYAKYLKQIGFTYSQNYIASALFHNPKVAKQLVELFYMRFNLDNEEKSLEQQLELAKEITTNLDEVASLDEDKILRKILSVMQATIRTNYFAKDEAGGDKKYFSFKLDPARVPDIPLPKPMFEIFVYSPRVEGVHLRGAKVARGGLRWSDRQEDFRTEILGLMKAQQVKNAVIVPLGAKGGFVAKQLPVGDSREEVMKEVIGCYQTFIRGLLDITDNIIDGEVVPPQSVVRYDPDDPYLVVAADKGTATFSDIANNVSQQYNFWLGDAFASGGSTGYDHKKMGITAKGAWESTKRHFSELGIDTQTTPFTVFGVGDMAGDVFGNGMLLSRFIKLVAAFNHMHIFIDPDPDPEMSFIERERLFNLPRSSWDDYSAELISKGGGVYKRSDKSIKLSQEVKAMLDIQEDELAPNDLIKAILKSRTDLFWNGGIGTFVKAMDELQQEAGDRANDAIRINANELRCKVVVEGGNLGLTQKARIEASQTGCRVNTDFIDNSAGVDCSDHEVNIKILLNSVVKNGDMTIDQRNELLPKMTEEVAKLVLRNNYLHTETLSIEVHSASQTVDLYRRYINFLEKEGRVSREIEFLPSDDELKERKARGQGLSRPELAVLMAYDKIYLKEEIILSDLPEDPFFVNMLESAFPKCLSEKYGKEMQSHSLRREIIATQLSNAVSNAMGVNFASRLHIETGAPTALTVKAYIVAQELFDLRNIGEEIRALKVSTEDQFNMILQLYFLLRRSTRWILRNCGADFTIKSLVDKYQQPLRDLKSNLDNVLNKQQIQAYKARIKEQVAKGVPEELAEKISRSIFLFHSLDILQASIESEIDLETVSTAYFMLSAKLQLNWLRKRMISHQMESQWDELARSVLLDDLDYQQRILTLNMLEHKKDDQTLDQCFNIWCRRNRALYDRWNTFLADVLGSESSGFVVFSVIMRELYDLAHAQ